VAASSGAFFFLQQELDNWATWERSTSFSVVSI